MAYMLTQEKTSHIVAVALLCIAVVITAVAGYFHIPRQNRSSFSNDQVCSQEAKQCPDGSYVGRTGPNCKFTPCATPSVVQVDTTDWKTYHDELSGFTVQYPNNWHTSAHGKGEEPIFEVRSFLEYNHGDVRPKGGLVVSLKKGCDASLDSNGFIVREYGPFMQLEKSFCKNNFQIFFELDEQATIEDKNLLESIANTLTINDTSTWQTYRNEEYGFKVRYPGDWVIEKNNDWDAVAQKEVPDSVIVFKNIDKGFTVFAMGIPGFGFPEGDVEVRQNEVIIDEVKATRRDFKESENFFVTISDFFSPSYAKLEIKTFGDLSLSLFDQILSTFKFID